MIVAAFEIKEEDNRVVIDFVKRPSWICIAFVLSWGTEKTWSKDNRILKLVSATWWDMDINVSFSLVFNILKILDPIVQEFIVYQLYTQYRAKSRQKEDGKEERKGGRKGGGRERRGREKGGRNWG